MGSNTNVKPWNMNFLTFISLKFAYLIPQMAILESGVWLDEVVQTYAYALFIARCQRKQARRPCRQVHLCGLP
jgi:hypothetical protein